MASKKEITATTVIPRCKHETRAWGRGMIDQMGGIDEFLPNIIPILQVMRDADFFTNDDPISQLLDAWDPEAREIDYRQLPPDWEERMNA